MKTIPALVRIIITQATLQHASGAISSAVFQQQIRRLSKEELEPKKLSLLIRDLPGGRRRFLIKEMSTGAVCEMMDFASDGTLETERVEATSTDPNLAHAFA